MGKTVSQISPAVLEQISTLFRERAPVLVEVRFPRMGTSSDWYLFEEEQEFQELLSRLGRGVEIHMASAWDVSMQRGKVNVQI